MTAGSKPPGKRGGGSPTCSFCGSHNVVRIIGDCRVCPAHEHRVLTAADDPRKLKEERRERNAHLDPGSPQI